MSTNPKKAAGKRDPNAQKRIPRMTILNPGDDSENVGQSVANLMSIMQSSSPSPQESRLNEGSIDDGMGGRINLDFEGKSKKA